MQEKYFLFYLLSLLFVLIFARMNKNLVSTDTYADLCGITPQQVRNRIYTGKINGIYIKGCLFIDKVLYPPYKAMSAGRPSAKRILSEI